MISIQDHTNTSENGNGEDEGVNVETDLRREKDDHHKRAKVDDTVTAANAAPTVYPNNCDNAGDFHWWYNGKDNVRAERRGGKIQAGEQTFLKKYYTCAEKKNGCKASKTIHSLPDGDSIQFKGVHNHTPPGNPKSDPEVKKKVLEQLSVGAKPSAIHSKLVNNAQHPITPRTVPTKQSIYNWQHQIAVSQLPTGCLFAHYVLFFYISPFCYKNVLIIIQQVMPLRT